jgi:hypothetical protein
MEELQATATALQTLGAIGFGTVIGWYVYFINRYRSGGVEWGDLATVIGVLGGAGILALFPAGSDLFGAYGIGLALGFFGYFLVLIILVTVSKNFDADWFLDGRRKRPEEPFYVPGEIVTPPRPPMVVEEDGVVDR